MTYPRCASGAHFYGYCECIGEEGLRARHADEALGVSHPWIYYYTKYGHPQPGTTATTQDVLDEYRRPEKGKQ